MWFAVAGRRDGRHFTPRCPGTKLPPTPPYLVHQPTGAGMRVAVIGTGIPGNAAAWTLSKRYPVTVYDRELRPCGHSHTVTIDYDGAPVAVDIGFIVDNELNYPDLTALFADLGVETVESCCAIRACSVHLPSAVGLFLLPSQRRGCADHLRGPQHVLRNSRLRDSGEAGRTRRILWLKGARLVPRPMPRPASNPHAAAANAVNIILASGQPND